MRRRPKEIHVPMWIRLLHITGEPVTEQFDTLMEAIELFGKTLARALVWPWRWQEILSSVIQIGVESIPIILISTCFAGLVVTHEIAWHMDAALHTVSMIPGFTGQFILRELGIAIPALLLVSKVGASITAEVGSMKVTEQLDALKLLKIDAINYLVFPRFVASVISGACLTLIAIAMTLVCAIGVAVTRYNFSFQEYLNALKHFVGAQDLVFAMIKGTAFGAVIPILSCAYGFRCRGGAEGVGTATTNSVVAETIVVIVLDFFMTYIFTLIA